MTITETQTVADGRKRQRASAGILEDIRTGDQALSMNGARSLLARDGKRPSLIVVYRWANPSRGATAVDGSRVVLETTTFPGGLTTSGKAVQRFLHRLAGIEAVSAGQVSQTEANAAATARLDAMGL